MQRFWRKSWMGLLVLCLIFLSACGNNGGGNASGEESGDIVIGAIGPLTGSTAQYGDSMKKNIELYIDEINQNGGINGRKIKLIVEDDEGKPEKGISAVKKLIEKDNAIAVLGSPLSPVNLAAMKETQKAGVPHIVTSAGNPKITEQDNPYVVRVVPKDTAIASAVATYLVTERLMTKIAILHSSDEYGIGGAEAAQKTLELLGKPAVAVEMFNTGDKDFTPQLTNIKKAGAEAIIFWGYYTEGAIVAKQNNSLGVNALVIGGTGLNNPKFLELAGDDAEGILFGSPFVASDASIQDYVNKYQAKYNTLPDMTGACGYDAAQLIVAAIQAVGTDKEAINQWLHQVRDFQGVTGVLTADENGDLNDKVKVIAIHKDGSQTIEWDPFNQKNQ